MTMEFDEMQKIWDAQNNQPLYAFNEKALHNRILVKMNKGQHITNVSELLLIVVNFGSATFIIGTTLASHRSNIFLYIMGAWMFGTAVYTLASRIKRISANQRYDRTMRGDLDYAIHIATYQANLSRLMRWNIVPIGTLVILSTWEGGKHIVFAIVILVFFALTFYLSGFEHRIYENRKHELEVLKEKLESENPQPEA
jgi:hypothetical protein